MAGKLTFAPNLYLGESIASEKLDKLKKRLEKKPHYKKEEFLILGIAAGYEEALQLIEQITGECLDARGDCNLREYLLC